MRKRLFKMKRVKRVKEALKLEELERIASLWMSENREDNILAKKIIMDHSAAAKWKHHASFRIDDKYYFMTEMGLFWEIDIKND